MSHISNIPLANQINLVPLEAESPEVHLIRKVRESVGIEIQEDTINLYQRETELALETDYDLLLTILEESDDETELKGALVHLALKAFKGDLGASDILVEYYVKGPQRDFPKAIYFFKIAMQYHTWDMNQYPFIDSILISISENMFKKASTPEEKDYLHEVEAILADYANKGFSDVKFHLALLYFLGGAVPQNLDRFFQYFQELWAVDLTDRDDAVDEKNGADFLLTKIMDLAKRGNEQAKQVITQIAEQETRPQRLSYFQVLKSQFDNSRFADVETLDHNPDYLYLIGDFEKLKKLADAENPKACLYMAEFYCEAAGDSETEDIKLAHLCTAIDGGELEALVHLFYNLDSLDDQMLSKFQNWLGDDFTLDRFQMLKEICQGKWTPDFAAREAYSQHQKAKEIYQKEVVDEQDKKRADQLERDAYLFARVAANFAGANESAIFTLAEIHAEGRVVERDLEKAFGLYFEAMTGVMSERIHDFAPYFLRSDKNSPFDEAARLAAILRLEALVETCKPGERGVHFTLGCVALQDEQNFEKVLGYFRLAVSGYSFVLTVGRLLTLKGPYEKVAFHLIEEFVIRAKAGDLQSLNDVMLVALCDIEDDATFSGYFYKLINDLLSSSLVSLEAREPYALAQVNLIKEKFSPNVLENLEPEYIMKALYAVENLYDVALTGDRKAFIQYYHYYEKRGYVDAPGGDIEEIIENVSLPDRRLANEGDVAALSNFLALLDDCPGLIISPAFQKSLGLIVANLISYLGPHIRNGQRDFGDLLTIIQMLDENGMRSEDVHNVAIELAEGNHELHLRLGSFYARSSKSQNIERAKLCLEDALVLTGHRVEDREALVQLYLESPVEMRGRYALCFLASYYLDLGDIDQVTIHLIQAVQVGAVAAVLPFVDYLTEEAHQDLDKAKAFMRVIFEEVTNDRAIDGASTLDAIHAMPSAFKLLNQMVDEGDRDALYFSGTYEDYLMPALRVERLKQAALKGHPFAFGVLKSFLGHYYLTELAIAEVLFHQNPDNLEVFTYLKKGVLAFDQQAIDLFLKVKGSEKGLPPAGWVLLGVLMIRGFYVEHDMFGINLLRLAAANGEHTASLILAEAYGFGFFHFDGVKIEILEDRPAALTYLNMIIGNARLPLEMQAEAYRVRGMIAYTEEPETRDFQVAFQDFRIATHLGSAKGEYLLGLCYLRGDGVPTDPAQGYIHTANAARKGSKLAVEWLIGIAENDNNPMAQFDLGQIFTTLEDYDAALHFYQMAADQGFPRAYVMMAQIHETLGDVDKVMPLYERAADENYLPAMEHVAEYYFTGSEDEEPNYHKAYLQYRFLSLNPELSPEYSYRLGSILFHGLGHVLNGVPRYADALPAYKRAAKRGHAAAQFMLGRMYNEGHGTERNREKALKYLRRAAEQGHEEARILFNLLTQPGPPA